MGFEVNVDFDDGAIGEAIADAVEERFREYVETEVANGQIECDCGSRAFDVETWETGSGDLAGGAVCRSCNERVEIDIDTSYLNDLR